MSAIPDHLRTPPDQVVNDRPVRSNIQELPFSRITWENFEKLCVRLVELTHDVGDCRQYGNRGEDQEGIDLYAKAKSSTLYTVFQCKNEADFGPAKIKEAVDLFVGGVWFSRSIEFVLCTRESLSHKQRQEEIIRQTTRLENESKSLTIWDSNRLNRLIKDHPKLVAEFFGMDWVKEFNGEAAFKSLASEKLPEKKLIDGPEKYIVRKFTDSAVDEFEMILRRGVGLRSLIDEYSRIAIVGNAGVGKSIEIQKLMSELSQPAEPYFPFLVKLNLFTDRQIKDYIPDIDRIPPYLIVLCLDGLDEVQSNRFDDVRKKILEFSNDYPQSRMIVSCRSNFFISEAMGQLVSSTLAGFDSYRLLPLTEEDVQDYLKSEIPLGADAFLTSVTTKGIYDLLLNPYYLKHIVSLYKKNKQIPNTKSDLFESIAEEGITTDAYRYFRDDVHVKKREMRLLLERLAFVLEYQGRNSCSFAELLEIAPTDEIKILRACGSLLRVSEEENVAQFVHNNIQEYLVGRLVASKDLHRIKKIISFKPDYKRIKPSWVNTLSFIVSSLTASPKKRSELIEWITSVQPQVLVQLEMDKLDEKVRYNVFIEIFNFYKKQGRSINRSVFPTHNLAQFASTPALIDYLIHEITHNSSAPSAATSLDIISYIRPEAIPPVSMETLKGLLDKNLLETKTSPYLSLKAYSNLFQINVDTFRRIVETYYESDDTWIRYAIFSSISKLGLQDVMIDFVISQIKTLMYGEMNSGNDRLSNEYDELRKSMFSIRTKASLITAWTFIKEEFGRLSYSIYFREIIPKTLDKTASEFSSDLDVLEKVLDVFVDEEVTITDDYFKLFLSYFQSTDRTLEAFKRLLETKDLDYHTLSQMTSLADDRSIALLANEFLTGKVLKKHVEDFQWLLGKNHPLLEKFNALVNVIETIPLPSFPDYDQIRQESDRLTKELIFSKEKFKTAAEKIFDDAGKDDLSFEDIWNLQKQDIQLKRPTVVFEALRLPRGDRTRNKTIFLDAIDRTWESLSIDFIVNYIKSHKDSTFSADEMTTITLWCDKMSIIVDFEASISQPRFDTTRVAHKAVYFSFLIRHFGVKKYSPELYLGMLSFPRWNDSEKGIFEFVGEVVSKSLITPRVLQNLRRGVKSNDVLSDHITYIVENQLQIATPELLKYLLGPFARTEVLDAYLNLGGELDDLLPLYDRIEDDFRFAILDRLVRAGHGPTEKYVLSKFIEADDDLVKLRLAEMLIRLQNLKGLRYYVWYLKTKKTVPGDSSPSNALYALKTLRAFFTITTLYELSFDKTIRQDTFNDLGTIAISALEAISLANDNFPHAKRLFRLYSVIFKIRNFIPVYVKLPTRIMNDLKHYFEIFEQRYYVSKDVNISLGEALVEYSKL